MLASAGELLAEPSDCADQQHFRSDHREDLGPIGKA